MDTLPVVLMVVNADWVFLQHRVAIAQVLKNDNYRIIVAARDTGKSNEIITLGFEFIHIDFSRKGLNPISEIKTVNQFYKICKKIKPRFLYQVTIKPIIYGSIIAKILNLKTVNTICGLGHVFSKNENNLLRRIVSIAYKNAVNGKNSHTFFENSDNQTTFLKLGILKKKSQSTVVNGAGVDLNKFSPVKKLNNPKKLVITLATRMLWDKGVKEFVDSAGLLNEKFKNKAEFRLYGMIDNGNPKSIPEDYLKSIEVKGYIKWYGFVDDMVGVFKHSDIVVLPSYYGEGLPTVLAEACAMGLPIITTNSVGCKECVDEGLNGFKVQIRSVSALANSIEKLVTDKALRLSMGKASRVKAQKDYDHNKIVEKYMNVFNSLKNKD